jgi:predicted nucleic acid-binding protein
VSVLLDTHVLSEILRTRPGSTVLAWFATQPANGLFVSAVTQAEMMLGARACYLLASDVNGWSRR